METTVLAQEVAQGPGATGHMEVWSHLDTSSFVSPGGSGAKDALPNFTLELCLGVSCITTPFPHLRVPVCTGVQCEYEYACAQRPEGHVWCLP